MGPVTHKIDILNLGRIDGLQIIFMGRQNPWFRILQDHLRDMGHRLSYSNEIDDPAEKQRRFLQSPAVIFHFDRHYEEYRQDLIFIYKNHVPIISVGYSRCFINDPFFNLIERNLFTSTRDIDSLLINMTHQSILNESSLQLNDEQDDLVDIQWTNAYREPIRKQNYLREKLSQLIFYNGLISDQLYEDIVQRIRRYLLFSPLSSRDKTKIEEYLTDFEQSKNPIRIVKLYSSTTSFHKYFNRCLARDAIDFFEPNIVDLHADYQTIKAFLQLGALVMHHDTLKKYRFQGQTYRGMILTPNDLEKYVVGSKILTKSFLSSSKERHIAHVFGGIGENRQLKANEIATLCLYRIRTEQIALDIEFITEQQAAEREVLIFPFSVFQVKHVQRMPDENVEMILEEVIDDDGEDTDLLLTNINR